MASNAACAPAASPCASSTSSQLEWTLFAKDGMDLPAHQRRTVPAVQPIAMGETYDMLAELPAAGSYRLEIRSSAGILLASQPITALARRP